MHSTYEFTVPVFIKALGGLRNFLVKTDEWAKAEGKDMNEILKSALAPDMFPLVKQIQIACDNAKLASARFAQTNWPKNEDTETTVPELLVRIDATIAFVKTITPEMCAGADTVQVTMPYFPGKFMAGFDYAREYALPNFFFHLTTAYGLMRHAGAPLGKADFMNGVPLHDLAA